MGVAHCPTMEATTLACQWQLRLGGTGVARLVSHSPLPGPHRVCNLEVHRDHTYHATGLGLLVRNACGGAGADAPKEVTGSRSHHPESAQHIEDAQAAGHPSELTVARPGADANRRAAQAGHEQVEGMQLDQYPPAFTAEGRAGADAPVGGEPNPRYNPREAGGVGDIGKLNVRNANNLPNDAKLSRDKDDIFKNLDQNHGISNDIASERLHKLKEANGLRGDEDVIIDRTGNVFNSHTGEKMGSLTEGGAKVK